MKMEMVVRRADAPPAPGWPGRWSLAVGSLRADGIVSVPFTIADSIPKPTTATDTLYPPPKQWYVARAGAPYVEVRGETEVRFMVDRAEGGPTWYLGQLTGAPSANDSIPSTSSPNIALTSALPMAFFRAEASAFEIRPRLMALLEAEFTDSTRREVWKNRPDLGPLGPVAPIENVRMWSAPIPESDDTLQVVQGERNYSGKWGSDTWIFDLWVVQAHNQLEIVRRGGPASSDPDYKGAPSEEPVALFRYNKRVFIVFVRSSYFGRWLALGDISGHHIVEQAQ
jgi:hypothetical protein